MAITDRARATVELDGNQAESTLESLKAKSKELKAELKQLKLEKDPGYADKKREYDSLNSQINKLNKSSFDLNGTLKNLSGASMKDLTRAQQVLTAQLRNTNRTTKEGQLAFAQKSEQLRKIRAEITLVRGQMSGLNQQMSLGAKAANGFNKYFGLIGSTIAMVTGTIMGMRKTVEVFNDFEESVSNLSALTGLSGDQLVWLEERAKASSIAVSDLGIRFSNSAKEIVDAYTMVGSKRPELLANREALAEVTESAMVLSKAAKIDLSDAATALTTVMNQFNESADQSNKIINILGAGSKVGAANVAYLNQVIEKSGTGARSANLSIEELVGTIEGVAPKFSQPADAGTALRNVFLRLQTLDDDLNPTIVGWSKSLENLAARQYDTAEITQMFGLRAVNMVQALIEGRKDIVKYTEAVTGSSVATEQAAVNSDNNAARLAQAKNRAQLLRIELGEKFAPALTFSTNSFSYFLKALKEVIENWDKYRKILLIGIGLILAYNFELVKAKLSQLVYNIAMKQGIGLKIKTALLTQKQIISEAALSGWRVKGSIATKAATAAQRVFNVVVSQFPGFALLAAIMAIIGAISLWDKYNKESVKTQVRHIQLMDENARINKKAALAAKDVQESMKHLNRMTAQGKKDLFDLNQEKLRSLEIDLEQATLNKTLAQENASKVTMMQTLGASFKSIISGKTTIEILGEKAMQNGKKAAQEFNESITETNNSIAQITGTQAELHHILTAEAQANAILGDSLSALEEKLNLYNLALKHAKIGSEEYLRLKDLIRQTQLQLNSAMEEGKETVDKATNAYQELSSAISQAQARLQHFAAVGSYREAMAVNAVIKNLEAQKTVIDGIVAAGGDVIAFLDNLEGAPLSEMEEMKAYNEQFLAEWGKASDEYERRQQELRDQRRIEEEKDHMAKIERMEWEAQRQLELQQAVRDAERQILDAALGHGFQLFNAYAYAEQDRRLSDLDMQRNRELANEKLTEEEKNAISEKYRKKEAEIKKETFIRQKRADIIQSVINTALAITRALPNPVTATLASVLGLMQTGVIAAQPIPQFYKGRYPVRGMDDNRLYMASLAGMARTGLYTRPSLVAERGEEIIIDSPTTKNIMLNYPHIMQGIMQARVPQFYKGRMPSEGNQGAITAATNQVNDQVLQSLNVSINSLVAVSSELLNHGVRGVWVYSDLMRLKQKVDQIEQQTNIK